MTEANACGSINELWIASVQALCSLKNQRNWYIHDAQRRILRLHGVESNIHNPMSSYECPEFATKRGCSLRKADLERDFCAL